MNTLETNENTESLIKELEDVGKSKHAAQQIQITEIKSSLTGLNSELEMNRGKSRKDSENLNIYK